MARQFDKTIEAELYYRINLVLRQARMYRFKSIIGLFFPFVLLLGLFHANAQTETIHRQKTFPTFITTPSGSI
jgi:hypothetical protein